MTGFNGIAPYLTNPLVLVGFSLFLIFGFYRVLVKAKVIGPLPRGETAPILNNLLRYAFILALVAIVGGFFLEYTSQSDSRSADQAPVDFSGAYTGKAEIFDSPIDVCLDMIGNKIRGQIVFSGFEEGYYIHIDGSVEGAAINAKYERSGAYDEPDKGILILERGAHPGLLEGFWESNLFENNRQRNFSITKVRDDCEMQGWVN